MKMPTSVVIDVELSLTHLAPAGTGLTRCCNHLVWNLKRTDRLTTDVALVTCPGAWLREVAS